MQLTLTKPNGQTLTIEADGQSVLRTSLMELTTLTLSFQMAEYTQLDAGTTVVFQGNT